MIKWPERARAAIKKLFEPLQDIDVYVEDTNDEVFYRALLNSVCTEKIRVARVFALGGRRAVIEAARSHDFSKRRALFVIDGDLFWVRGVPAPNIPGLHQHEAYCIENILLCEKALALVLSQDAVLTVDDATRTLDFKTWCRSIERPLVELFAAFGTAHEIYPQIPTVSQGVGAMCLQKRQEKRTVLDPQKSERVREKTLADAEQVAPKELVESTYVRILARLESLEFPLQGVSGKDFLLPLADFLLQSHGCRIKRRSLRIRLATAGDMTRFSALYDALRIAAEGHA